MGQVHSQSVPQEPPQPGLPEQQAPQPALLQLEPQLELVPQAQPPLASPPPAQPEAQPQQLEASSPQAAEPPPVHSPDGSQSRAEEPHSSVPQAVESAQSGAELEPQAQQPPQPAPLVQAQQHALPALLPALPPQAVATTGGRFAGGATVTAGRTGGAERAAVSACLRSRIAFSASPGFETCDRSNLGLVSTCAVRDATVRAPRLK